MEVDSSLLGYWTEVVSKEDFLTNVILFVITTNKQTLFYTIVHSIHNLLYPSMCPCYNSVVMINDKIQEFLFIGPLYW
jgi:hypothetical protein